MIFISQKEESVLRALRGALVAIALAGCSGKAPEIPPLAEDDVVVAFGDSLTYGTGAKAEESYPAVLAQLRSEGGARRCARRSDYAGTHATAFGHRGP
jgi:hypothetical protein